MKSPSAQKPSGQSAAHPMAIVAPIVNENDCKRAKLDGKTTPKTATHQQRCHDDEAESDDASSAIRRLAINDKTSINNSSNNSSRNASWIDSAMPTMSPRSELQHQQQNRLYQSRAAVTLSSKNSKQRMGRPGHYEEDEDEEERELEEMRKEEEERKKDREFLFQIRRDLMTEFIGEDGKTRKDAETQTLSTGRILVTEMFMNDEI